MYKCNKYCYMNIINLHCLQIVKLLYIITSNIYFVCWKVNWLTEQQDSDIVYEISLLVLWPLKNSPLPLNKKASSYTTVGRIFFPTCLEKPLVLKKNKKVGWNYHKVSSESSLLQVVKRLQGACSSQLILCLGNIDLKVGLRCTYTCIGVYDHC